MNNPNNTASYISCPSCGELFSMDTSHICKKTPSTDREQELLNRLIELDKMLEKLEHMLEGVLKEEHMKNGMEYLEKNNRSNKYGNR